MSKKGPLTKGLQLNFLCHQSTQWFTGYADLGTHESCNFQFQPPIMIELMTGQSAVL